MIKTYTKIATVDAVQWNGTPERLALLKEWGAPVCVNFDDPRCLFITTLEDGSNTTVLHYASLGDYICRGVDGEFWAVKPSIFEKTYEEMRD